MLLTYGAHTETRDRAGMTPLMKAVRHHNLEMVLLLLSHGADVNAISDTRNDYRTVLHYAILSGHVGLTNLLLKQGAKVDIIPPEPEPDRPSPLDLAILRGEPALVRMLLEAGANVNRCSPVIGSPLHVVCADNIPHRFEMMKMLLSYGANPNIRVLSDPAGTNILRPPLAELLASNEIISMEEIHLLLKYGARVVMKTQFRDPDGLLNCFNNITDKNQILETLVGAAEEFDPCMIRRNSYLTPDQRKLLLDQASVPLTLKAQSRAFFRKLFGRSLPESVPNLFIPITLRRYLLYEHS